MRCLECVNVSTTDACITNRAGGEFVLAPGGKIKNIEVNTSKTDMNKLSIIENLTEVIDSTGVMRVLFD